MKAQSRREIWIAAALALVLLGVMPALNAWVPESSFFFVSNFTINVWGKYLAYGILAISVDLLWGYTGLLSLGQALFFSLGGYMLGMHLMLMIGKLGQYKSDLPDFLVFLGHTYLPAFWRPFYSLTFTAVMVFLLPMTISAVFGLLAFRSRIKGVYFSILTQALTYGASLMFFRNDMLMGGNNGFTDFKFILGSDLRSAATQRVLYIFTGLVLLGVYFGCRWLTRTKFGLVQRAIRDSETRVLFSGYSAVQYKLFVFVISAAIAAVGGALYVAQVGIINPSEMTPDKSLEAVVWVAVGGRGTLVGPILGAVLVNALKSWATHAIPDLWLILLGSLFLLVVLFLPKGIISIPSVLLDFYKRRIKRPEPEAPTPVTTSSTL
jgi:urea transport system permease protein